MAKINLDLTNIKAEGGSMFSKVPAGKYTVSLAHSEFKEKGESSGLQIGFMIENGEHKGKMVPDYINIVNPSEKAVEMGLGRLRKICDVQNRKSFKLVNDSDLINRVAFFIDVEVKENEYQGKTTEVNEVKKIYALEPVKGETTKDVKSKVEDKKELEEVAKEVAAKMPWD